MTKIQTDQTNARTLHAEGLNLLQNGQGAAAVAKLQAAATAAPSAEYLSDLAVALQMCGQMGPALQTFKQAVSRFPLAQEPRCNLAKLLAAQNHTAEALALLEDIPKDIRQADTHTTCGLMLYKLARRKDAISAFEQARAQAPDVLPLRHMLAKCYNEEKDWGAALSVLAEAEAIVARSPEKTLSLQHYLMQGWAAMNRPQHSLAMQALSRALELDPENDAAEEMLARLNGSRFRPDLALPHYNHLSARHPDNARYHDGAAQMLMMQQHYDAAILRLKTAQKYAPDAMYVACHLADALTRAGHRSEAQNYIRTQIERFPESADIRVIAGYCHLINGNYETAAENYLAALRLNPHISALYLRLFDAGLSRIGVGALREKITTELARSDLTPAEKADLNLALSLACEKEGDYPTALHHLNLGNAFKRSLIEYDETFFLGMLAQIQETHGWDFSQRTTEQTGPGFLFVLGLPRSGTSLVEQILASHTAIFGAGERAEFTELVRHMLPKDPRQWQHTPEETFRRMGMEYTRQIAPLATDARWIVDKMPSNGTYAGLILRVLPNAKIIWVERDAMDSCFSCYQHFFTGNLPYVYDQAELGRYARSFLNLMHFWKRVLPADRFLHLRYEELVAAPEEKMRELIAFCGLEWQDACLHFEKTERPVLTSSAGQVRKPLNTHTGGRWKHYGDGFAIMQAALNGEIPIPEKAAPPAA